MPFPRSALPGFLLSVLTGASASAADAAERDASQPGQEWSHCQPYVIRTLAGVQQRPVFDQDFGLAWRVSGDGGPARDAGLGAGRGVAVGPDGTIYFCSTDAHAVRKVTPDGIVQRVAGIYGERADYGDPAAIGDGGPALAARLDQPMSLAVGPDGSLYILDLARIRRVAPDGVITTVAGTALAPPYTFTPADVESLGRDFRFTGPATAAPLHISRLGQWMIDPQLEVARDGTIYLLTNTGIRRIDPAGMIAPLIEGGSTGATPAYVGAMHFSAIALDAADRLHAVGGQNGIGSSTSSGAAYRIDPTGVVTRVFGNDDVNGFFFDAAWNVGPATPNRCYQLLSMRFDATGRMWFNPTMDGAHLFHLDDDGVIRWSGEAQTHAMGGAAFNVEGGPAPLHFRTRSNFNNAFARLPSGGWVLFTSMSDADYTWPALRVVAPGAPDVAPALEIATDRVELTVKLGDPLASVDVPIRNTGTLFGAVDIRSDADWLSGAFPSATNQPSFLPGATVTSRVYVTPTAILAPGDYTGHLGYHLLAGSTPPRIVTVTVHVLPPDAPLDLAPVSPPIFGTQSVDEDRDAVFAIGARDDRLAAGQLTYALTAPPEHGTATISGTTLTYRPDPDFNSGTWANQFHMPETIRWTVSDGVNTVANGVQIYVRPVNDPPVVDAGPDLAIAVGAVATLAGGASDVDGFHDNALRRWTPQLLQPRWSAVSGPGQVSFSDPTDLHATASFSQPGQYVLRLTVNDTVVEVADQVAIDVGHTEEHGADPGPGGTTTGSGPTANQPTGTGGGCGAGTGVVGLALALGLTGARTRRRKA